MNAQSVFNSIGRTARNHGKTAALYDVLMRTLNKCLYVRTLQCAIFDSANPQPMELPPHLRFVKLESQDLFKYAQTPEYEISSEFVSQALAKGDECYAILDGDVLASYGWYSRNPTLTNSSDLILHFDPRYIYMYKAFTLERYRGQRLHAVGVTRCLALFQSLGFKGLLCYVESNNFDSLKSSYRMGYRSCGQIHVARIAGKYFIWTQAQCREYGLMLRLNPSRRSSIGERAYQTR